MNNNCFFCSNQNQEKNSITMLASEKQDFFARIHRNEIISSKKHWSMKTYKHKKMINFEILWKIFISIGIWTNDFPFWKCQLILNYQMKPFMVNEISWLRAHFSVSTKIDNYQTSFILHQVTFPLQFLVIIAIRDLVANPNQMLVFFVFQKCFSQ